MSATTERPLPPEPPSTAAAVGQVMGNYRLVRPLGTGGMGQVFLAEHVVLGRLAAVKVLHPELCQQREALVRFFNEARTSAALRHPGLIEVYDFGWEPSGAAYIVMELLEGASLRDLLERGTRLPADFAVGVIRQVAEAMALAHAHSIVHRDLKPENLFLVPDAQIALGCRVKVLDFGICKLHGDAALPHSVTRTGNILGTPAYMAPEQCHGAGHVDERSDVYSLGCILFEMLCGRPPFVSDGVGAIIASHLLEPTPTLVSLCADVTPELEAVVQAMLVKAQGDRIGSMTELIARLAPLPGGSGEAVAHPELLAWSTTLALGSGANRLPTPGQRPIVGIHSLSGLRDLQLPLQPPFPTPPTPAPSPTPPPQPQQVTRPLGSPSRPLTPRSVQVPPLPPAELVIEGRPSVELLASEVLPRGLVRPRRMATVVALVGGIAAAVWIAAGAPLRSPKADAAIVSSLPMAQADPVTAPRTPAPAPLPRPAVQITPLAAEAAPGEPAEASDSDSDDVADALMPLAAPPTVTWRIESHPAGAKVVRESDGAELGRTPLELQVAAGDGRESLSLVRNGYRTARTILPLDRDARTVVELSRPPRARASAKASKPVEARPLKRSGPIADDALDPYGD